MLTLVLRNEGFLSEIVTRGDAAMAAFRSFRPDVVLLDLMLPGRTASTSAARSGPSPAYPS